MQKYVDHCRVDINIAHTNIDVCVIYWISWAHLQITWFNTVDSWPQPTVTLNTFTHNSKLFGSCAKHAHTDLAAAVNVHANWLILFKHTHTLTNDKFFMILCGGGGGGASNRQSDFISSIVYCYLLFLSLLFLLLIPVDWAERKKTG